MPPLILHAFERDAADTYATILRHADTLMPPHAHFAAAIDITA